MSKLGVSLVVALLLIVVVAVASSLLLYIWVTGYTGETLVNEDSIEPKLKAENIRLSPFGVVGIYVRNIGERRINLTGIYIKDPSGLVFLYRELPGVIVEPGEVKIVTVDRTFLKRSLEPETKYLIEVSSSEGVITLSYVNGKILRQALERELEPLALLARIYSGDHHWVVFNYLDGEYKIYGDYAVPSPPQLVVEGVAPILHWTNEYTISDRWLPWSQRPIDSPIVIVYNPTNGQEDWVFTWHDPHGIWRFYLQPLGGDVAADFLVLWEDIYYPPTTPTMDDWKDHVVRVTAFFNGTYRLAVYMAKGGYSHRFYVSVGEPYENILAQPYAYQKPHGAYWSNFNGTYYLEFRVYYVKKP